MTKALLTAVLAMLAALVLRPPSAHAQNLLQNSDFNTGLAGWTVVSGTFAIDALEGLPEQPSLHAIAAPVGGFEAIVNSPCIQMSAPQNVDLYANIKHVSGNVAEVNVYGFTDTACANFGNIAALIATTQDGDVWTIGSYKNAALPSGTHSVMVSLNAGSSSAGGRVDTYFDHILFGPAGTIVPIAAPVAAPMLSVCGMLLLVLSLALAGICCVQCSQRTSANYSVEWTAATCHGSPIRPVAAATFTQAILSRHASSNFADRGT